MNWRTSRWCVIDSETTGTDPAVARIVDLGVVIVENGEIAERFGWLINSGGAIPAECTAIHGITDEMVRDEKPFADVAVDFAQAVSGAIPVAFNGRFDRALLLSEYLRAGFVVPPPLLQRGDENAWIDALVWARAHDPYVKGAGRHKLGAVAARMGVEAGAAHRAVGDCETTARVLSALANVTLHREAAVSRMPEAWTDLVLHQRRLAALQDADFIKWLLKQPKKQEHAA